MTKLEGKVALGRSYTANPDLVERFATGAPLAEVGWQTVYGSGARGYSGYPSGGGRVNSIRGANAHPSERECPKCSETGRL
jgi:hypothetical protein